MNSVIAAVDAGHVARECDSGVTMCVTCRRAWPCPAIRDARLATRADDDRRRLGKARRTVQA